jgi:uncharacterized protein
MSKPAAKAPEPSMEEILASIRRIISDESTIAAQQAAPAPAPVAAASEPAPPPAPTPKPAAPAAVAPVPRVPEPPVMEEDADVLELTEMVATKPADDFSKAEPDVMFREPEPMPAPAPRYSAPVSSRDEQIMSQQATSAVSAAFGSLTNTMFSSEGKTVDDIVREMMRPMLKAWLDDNLPSLVERLVRSEIERVSRGR